MKQKNSHPEVDDHVQSDDLIGFHLDRVKASKRVAFCRRAESSFALDIKHDSYERRDFLE